LKGHSLKRHVLLDIIRIVAVTLLLTAHIGQTLNHPIGRAFGIRGFYHVSLGGLAVTLFLILSGLVLELQNRKHITYRDFIIKRVLRIYPVYYLALIIGISVYFYEAFRSGQSVIASLSTLGPWDILLSLTGCYAFAGLWGGPFLATSWFIGLIMSMYLVYPFLSYSVRRNPYTTIFLVFVVSAFVRYIFGQYQLLPHRPLDWFPLCRVFEFTLGIFFAHVIGGKYYHAFANMPGNVKKAMQFMGELSFPLYLVHQPFCVFIPRMMETGFGSGLSIFLFLMVSVVGSAVLLIIDRRIPRKRMIEFLKSELIDVA
jgi:peptidoglycan/LPS O-acetylase OafA/YrhL